MRFLLVEHNVFGKGTVTKYYSSSNIQFPLFIFFTLTYVLRTDMFFVLQRVFLIPKPL